MEGVAMWRLQFFVDTIAADLVTICLTLRKDVNASVIFCRGIEGHERIFIYVEAVKCLLNSYTTKNIISKSALEISLLKTVSNQMDKQFGKAL